MDNVQHMAFFIINTNILCTSPLHIVHITTVGADHLGPMDIS